MEYKCKGNFFEKIYVPPSKNVQKLQIIYFRHEIRKTVSMEERESYWGSGGGGGIVIRRSELKEIGGLYSFRVTNVPITLGAREA